MMEVERIPPDLSAEHKRRYLFFKQINTINAFRKRRYAPFKLQMRTEYLAPRTLTCPLFVTLCF